mgnify:CR=1 FL=1
MIPDMIHTPYIVPRISVMAPPPVTAERFVDELLSGLRMPDGGFVAHLAPSGDCLLFQQGHQRVAGTSQLCQRPCPAGGHRVTNGRYHPTAFGSGADLYGRIGWR